MTAIKTYVLATVFFCAGAAVSRGEASGKTGAAHSQGRHERAAPQDGDFDGFSDELERKLGTDPRSSASRPTLADNHDKIAAYWPLTSHAEEMLAGEPNGVLPFRRTRPSTGNGPPITGWRWALAETAAWKGPPAGTAPTRP